MKNFNQLCVWPGTSLGDNSPKDFERFIADTFNGTRAKFVEVVETLPDETGPGGRSDLFFFIHTDDVPKFAVPRLSYGIRWWEDVLSNGGRVLYPTKVLERYPRRW